MKGPWNGFSQIWLPVLLWMLFIYILSSVSGKDIPDFPVPYFHKMVHFFEYSILGGLWIRAFLLRRPGAPCLKFSILAWTLTTIFAFSDEWHQTFVPGRSGKLEDVFFDMIWAVLGILLYLHGQHKPGQKHSPKKDALA
ncbi:MAG: VanZ family protein [Candidatus Omnitrophota bacterium]